MNSTTAQAAQSSPAKQRTITLTNRAPIRILEEEWPVIAKGDFGQDYAGDLGWLIEIRVRRRIKVGDRKIVDGDYLVHARYWVDTGREDDQSVRVGRVVDARKAAASGLWNNIQEVGEELRTRIDSERLRKFVIHAVDACFASLPPQEM